MKQVKLVGALWNVEMRKRNGRNNCGGDGYQGERFVKGEKDR